MKHPYEIEVFPEDSEEDDGTMTENAKRLEEVIIGRKIVKAEKKHFEGEHSWDGGDFLTLTLDNHFTVVLKDTDDCCAFTGVEAFRLIDSEHVITSVGTADGFQKWFIYSDKDPAMEIDVEWSCGNPFYYGYGFSIEVIPLTIVVDPNALEGGKDAKTTK